MRVPLGGVRGVPAFLLSADSPPQAANKKKRDFLGTPQTPAGRLRPLHPLKSALMGVPPVGIGSLTPAFAGSIPVIHYNIFDQEKVFLTMT